MEKVITGPPRRVVVARSQVWASALNFFKARRRISSNGILMVNFVGDFSNFEAEDAVDQGGPRREFFRLLQSDMIRSSGMLQCN